MNALNACRIIFCFIPPNIYFVYIDEQNQKITALSQNIQQNEKMVKEIQGTLSFHAKELIKLEDFQKLPGMCNTVLFRTVCTTSQFSVFILYYQFTLLNKLCDRSFSFSFSFSFGFQDIKMLAKKKNLHSFLRDKITATH